MITKNVTVYLGDGYPVRIPMSQYDTMWELRFKVFLDDEEWTIPPGATVKLNYRRPDGTTNSKACAVYSLTNIVSSTVDSELTGVAGDVVCELTFVSDNKTVSTANFVIEVEPSPNE